ncbi:acetyl-coenzyme A synthetase [Blastomyces gilchristii SLH14081]|uniref:medium-chain acyl-CoA ligase n=1 Tax=Blastomyces gilchristii (strain SLH14081) TaxID=559298 RepID=A0A179UHX5_BLAGS|nr:acetyl-coenzyme A synthetase [Blastomyces gilchristii SLH14081]OAT07594.1 acetyl-coenzyme A synthetase [Blastomyces gilchristii SLH14081]
MIIVFPRVPAWWEIATAAIGIGVVVCPCPVLAVAHDIKYRAEASKASIFVGDTVSISKFKTIQRETPKNAVFKDVLPKTKWSDPSVIYFTSGTTGMPKMVLHDQVSYPLAHVLTSSLWLGLGEGSMGMVRCLGLRRSPVRAGDCQAFNAESALGNLHDIPLLLSAPLPPLIGSLCYLQGTETTLVCGNLKGGKIKYSSMGLPVPGVPLTDVNEKGDESPPFEEGKIAIATTTSSGARTINVFSSYMSPDRKVMLPQQQGRSCSWYLTGDRAYKDEDEYLWFVSPFEVESVLKKHAAVIESAVMASPDPDRVKVVKAFIVLQEEFKLQNPDSLIAEIQKFCKKETAPYKYSQQIQFVEPSFLLKTISGKIKRVKLRALKKALATRGVKI